MAKDYDDDDDRPRRPRRDEADDYDDAPRRRRGGKPHRGTLILVLGLLGLCCLPTAIVAIVLGIIDLGAMKRGEMDESGRGLTTAGLIIGIVMLVLGIGSNIFFFNNPNMFK